MSSIDNKNDNRNTKEESKHWVQQLTPGHKGPLSNAANLDLIVQNDAYFENRFGFNDMTRMPETMEGAGWRILADHDITEAQIYVQRSYLKSISFQNVKQVILTNCMRFKRHPIRDWLSSIKWDGIPRIPAWTVDYLGCKPTPYNMAVGEMFLISAVARIFQPGCKCDYVLVLEGEQGLEKSKVWKTLFQEHYASLTDITGKDTSMKVSRYWCLEMTELNALNRHDNAMMKAFITQQIEQFRPPYGQFVVEFPRQCVLAATGNEYEYLKDPTGGRRWWGIVISRIDIEALEIIRDQLFAEAVHRFRAGQQWWPDRDFERKYIVPEQDARQVVDELVDVVGAKVNDPISPVVEIQIQHLWAELFPLEKTLPIMLQRRLADALRYHGFERVRVKRGAPRVWVRTLHH